MVSIDVQPPRFVICKHCNNSNQGCERCIHKKVGFRDVNWNAVNKYMADEMLKVLEKESPYTAELFRK